MALPTTATQLVQWQTGEVNNCLGLVKDVTYTYTSATAGVITATTYTTAETPATACTGAGPADNVELSNKTLIVNVTANANGAVFFTVDTASTVPAKYIPKIGG
nr:hypothetical protein [Thalassolituus oleivorans]